MEKIRRRLTVFGVSGFMKNVLTQTRHHIEDESLILYSHVGSFSPKSQLQSSLNAEADVLLLFDFSHFMIVSTALS